MRLWPALAVPGALAASLLAPCHALSASPLALSSSPAAPTLLVAESLAFAATAAPAVADIDGDGRPEVAMSVDNIGYVEPPQMDSQLDPANPNTVTLRGWYNGALRPLPGWPGKTRDATLGVSLIDVSGDGIAEVVGSCSQDNRPPLGFPYFVSRMYVWDSAGAPVAPWAPWSILAPNPATGNETGTMLGHSYAAPVGFEDAGQMRILQVSQGVWGYWDGPAAYYPKHGGLSVWAADGTLMARTSTAGPLWTVVDDPAVSMFSVDVPPVIARRDGAPTVVAATKDGVLYQWWADGSPVSGFYPAPNATTETDRMANGVRAAIRAPIAAADLDDDGRDEILVASGEQQTPNGGAVTCWSPEGALLWRFPLLGFTMPFTSGVAVGRLGGRPVASVVVGDAGGRVFALNRRGGVLWRFETAPGTPPGRFPILAEPVIGDVNADGAQDVVVGGTNGYLYALDGRSGALLWKARTPGIFTGNGFIPGLVLGAPALCDLQNDGRLDIVVVTWQRYHTDRWYGFGHLLVFDCGPGTYNPDALDWPQYRQNAMRTGRALRP